MRGQVRLPTARTRRRPLCCAVFCAHTPQVATPLDSEPEALTVGDLQRILRIGQRAALRLIRTQEIPARNVGTPTRPRWRIAREHVAAYLAGSDRPPPAAGPSGEDTN